MRFSEDYNLDSRFWRHSPEREAEEEAKEARLAEDWPEVSERFSEMTETDITNSPPDEATTGGSVSES